MHLNIIRADDSLTHVAIVGRMDVQGVTGTQYEFLHQTTSLPRPTLVDLSKVTFIGSLGIGMLVSAAKYLERHGTRMALLSPTELVRKSLETAGLHQVIPIAYQESTALELLRMGARTPR